jgi:hypothetical protein
MKRFIPTRWSHLVGYSGVGALVRADNDLFVVMDIGHWVDKDGEPAGEPLCYVDLLRGTLGLEHKELRQPPLARLVEKGPVEGTCVPALRFPGWARCPSCGLLHYLPWRAREDRQDGATEDPRCRCESHSRLRQVDWVLAHPDGGLGEVPWHFLAHLGSRLGRDCRENRVETYLRLRRDPSIGRWILRCDRCKASAGFNPQQPLALRSDPTRQPWQRWATGEALPSRQDFGILEVNDPRLYLPWVTSGLVIPPESQVPRGSVLDRLFRNRSVRTELDRCRTRLACRGALRRLSDEFGCGPGELEDALNEIERGWPLYGKIATSGQLLEKEYRALTRPIPDQLEGEDFVTDHRTDAWQALAPEAGEASRTRALRRAVRQLVAVKRLREVRIFLGFSRVGQRFDDRIRPNSTSDVSEPTGRVVPPDLDGSQSWLPAIELYGEGIFFILDEAVLRPWERQDGLLQRARTLQQRLERAGIRFAEEPPSPLTPRFILLHTLAHLLIRRLEAEAGYPAASIRERIYCAGGKTPMTGILAYVAVPDVAGSLGGLAELAEPRRFLQLLASVFDQADWCSLDPVCSEHEGQGPSQLNRAACHACTLVPEPSCQFGNLLLDRVFVAGDLRGEVRPLLAFAGED